MADLRIALLDLKEESDSGRAMAPAARRGRLPVPAVAAALGIAVAIMRGSAWWVLRSKGPPQMPVPRALTFDSGVAVFPSHLSGRQAAGLRERPRRWNEP
jgi:hypothetical protein